MRSTNFFSAYDMTEIVVIVLVVGCASLFALVYLLR
jgi:hypothetical protein